MSLENQFNTKLLELKNKIERAENAYKIIYSLINQSLYNEILSDELNRLFALKKNELSEIYKEFAILTSQSLAIENHKEIILLNDKTVKRAIEVIEKHSDGYSNFIACITALSIYLQNRLKEI